MRERERERACWVCYFRYGPGRGQNLSNAYLKINVPLLLFFLRHIFLLLSSTAIIDGTLYSSLNIGIIQMATAHTKRYKRKLKKKREGKKRGGGGGRTKKRRSLN